MNIAYVRVSTVEQNEERQVQALTQRGIEKWFTEKVSGKDTQRPQLEYRRPAAHYSAVAGKGH